MAGATMRTPLGNKARGRGSEFPPTPSTGKLYVGSDEVRNCLTTHSCELQESSFDIIIFSKSQIGEIVPGIQVRLVPIHGGSSRSAALIICYHVNSVEALVEDIEGHREIEALGYSKNGILMILITGTNLESAILAADNFIQYKLKMQQVTRTLSTSLEAAAALTSVYGKDFLNIASTLAQWTP